MTTRNLMFWVGLCMFAAGIIGASMRLLGFWPPDYGPAAFYVFAGFLFILIGKVKP